EAVEGLGREELQHHLDREGFAARGRPLDHYRHRSLEEPRDKRKVEELRSAPLADKPEPGQIAVKLAKNVGTPREVCADRPSLRPFGRTGFGFDRGPRHRAKASKAPAFWKFLWTLQVHRRGVLLGKAQ